MSYVHDSDSYISHMCQGHAVIFSEVHGSLFCIGKYHTTLRDKRVDRKA
jgi:hypothetical protein